MDAMRNVIRHYASLRYEDLPTEAVQAAKNLVLDALACALAGSSAPLNPESWSATPAGAARPKPPFSPSAAACPRRRRLG